MNLLPISIASYSFHNMVETGRMDIFQYLEIIKSRYNVTYADIWSGILPNIEEDFIKRVREEMDRRGIILANLCVDGPHLWMPTAEEREHNRLRMLQFIKAAEILGAKTIRIDFGASNDGNEYINDEALDYVVKQYKEYCNICGDLGMKIGPENHWGYDQKIENLLKVWKAVDHPAYGHLLHLGNLTDFIENMDALLPIIMHTHVSADSLPVAKEVIRRLAAVNYKGTLSVEHHTGNLEIERVEWQLASVREICAELEQEGLDSPSKPDYFSTVYVK